MEYGIIDTFLRWGEVSILLSLYYILFSLGLTLIFGFHQVVNFAHGAFYMVGAFIGFFIYNITGNLAAALIVSAILVMLIAALVERGLISRLYGTDPANSFLLTFAIGLTFVGIMKLIAGSQFKNFPTPEFLSGVVTIRSVTVAQYDILFMVVAVAFIIGTYMLLTKTKIGVIIRAGTANRMATEVLGINIRNYFTLLFAIGSGLAAVAGVLIAPLVNLYPGMGDLLILWAFIIVIIGGLGSFWGAIIGGVMIGILHSVGSMFLAQWTPIVTFAILIVILSIRPRGILGRKD